MTSEFTTISKERIEQLSHILKKKKHITNDFLISSVPDGMRSELSALLIQTSMSKKSGWVAWFLNLLCIPLAYFYLGEVSVGVIGLILAFLIIPFNGMIVIFGLWGIVNIFTMHLLTNAINRERQIKSYTLFLQSRTASEDANAFI